MKISIVTVNLNDAAGLDKTIRSVAEQIGCTVEYIVVDGGSRDGSLDVIDRWRERIDQLVVEPDRGLYDAQNKGGRLAQGDYLLFLNSGDFLVSPDVIKRVLSIADSSALLFGSLVVGKPDGSTFVKEPLVDARLQLVRDTLWHPCTFISKSLFDRLGGYHWTDYRIVADFEFWLRAVFHNGASWQRLEFPIAEFNLNGLSSDPINWGQLKKEKVRARRKNKCWCLRLQIIRFWLIRRFVGMRCLK